MTKLKQVNGVDVLVDDKGKFSATIGKRSFADRSLAKVEKWIRAEQAATPAIWISSSYSGAHPVESRLQATTVGYDAVKERWHTSDGGEVSPYSTDRLYIHDEAFIARADALRERWRAVYNEYRREWDALLEEWPRLQKPSEERQGEP